MLKRWLCLLFLFVPLFSTATEAPDPAREQIRQRIDVLQSGAGLELQGHSVASEIVLPKLYENAGFAPLWENRRSVDQLFTELQRIEADGLDPDDYHYRALVELRESPKTRTDPALQADFDLLMTDAMIRMGYHLLVGKVDPEELDSDWNMQDTVGDLDTVVELARAIDDGRVATLVKRLRPQHEAYEGLRRALAHYRRIRDDGGWPVVPPGATLKPGMDDPRVIPLRARLVASGDMSAVDMDSPVFDAQVEEGVRAFQKRHNLEVDGKAGKGTLGAMNVPVEARIDQIRVNLERARWVLHSLPQEFILADIAGFRVTYFRGGIPVWEGRSQVGKPYRRTPVFRSQMKYLVMNPTWTVPPTILREDILPKLRKDPSYLARKNMRVIDYSGNTVDASGIDWKQVSARNFRYLIRQDPGPDNALGRIKFMFPNDHAVYLHDTNHRDLFGRSERAFSSGCIRIEKPFDLAELLLDDPGSWSRERILEVINGRQTQNVNLPRPVTVILMYWTAYMGTDGKVHFRKDIYGRDRPVLEKLNDRFRFRRSPVIRG